MNYALTFLEGFMAFLSPCLLPMIPIYLSFLGGESKDRKIMIHAFGFVLGFSMMFIIMGAFSGSIGYLLQEYHRVIQVVSGVIVILFGLVFMDVFHLSFLKGFSYQPPQSLRFLNAVMFGIIFSVGWTPCVGAFLGSALMSAANSNSIITGISLLTCYSIGMAVPFLLSALLYQQLQAAFTWVKRHYDVINKVSGGILIIAGFMMMMGWLNI